MPKYTVKTNTEIRTFEITLNIYESAKFALKTLWKHIAIWEDSSLFLLPYSIRTCCPLHRKFNYFPRKDFAMESFWMDQLMLMLCGNSSQECFQVRFNYNTCTFYKIWFSNFNMLLSDYKVITLTISFLFH